MLPHSLVYVQIESEMFRTETTEMCYRTLQQSSLYYMTRCSRHCAVMWHAAVVIVLFASSLEVLFPSWTKKGAKLSLIKQKSWPDFDFRAHLLVSDRLRSMAVAGHTRRSFSVQSVLVVQMMHPSQWCPCCVTIWTKTRWYFVFIWKMKRQYERLLLV